MKWLVTTMIWCTVGFMSPSMYASHKSGEFSKEVMEDRIQSLSSDIDIQYTPQIEQLIKTHTTRGKKGSQILLGKVNVYFPIIENEVYSKDLPEILKYIPVIESSLRPDVRSRAGAVGLWQFMKSTAEMYDLEVNRMVDERKDPLKSTKAATEYLQNLYEKFGDWTLAIAAYNCGPGNVRKAIRKSGSRDYWTMRKYLPRETRKYIPKLIAAAYLLKYYHYHGLQPALIDTDLLSVGSTTVYQKIDFKELANELDLELDVLTQLNAEYLKKYIPESDIGYNLDIPASKLIDFYKIYQPENVVEQETINHSLDLNNSETDAYVDQRRKKKLIIQNIQKLNLPDRIPSMEEVDLVHQEIAEN